ncbi:DUF1176 domain-containing protein [Chitinimonas arctica]|uniref:DUF1176 domain-containing protein n=1 Tax=Chitinimonas arctica TaxID=2594795 RepID=A0A516SLQ1_9NEIS|nr:DUF1176 domain-containing protein [Chitinimonas arctica]QDQ29069.1 DUF1176 domain-containing protein [Chitinimonas arctica]
MPDQSKRNAGVTLEKKHPRHVNSDCVHKARFARQRPLPLILLTVAHLASQAAPLPVYREFKDWLVACSNDGACVAKGYEQTKGTAKQYEGSPEMVLEQAPGPQRPDSDDNSRLVLRFQSKHKLALPQLRLNGKALSADGWEIGHHDPTWILSRNSAAARKLLATARRKQLLRLTNRQGRMLANFKVTGLTAALLLIDETQGRLGTTQALLRTGSKSASTIPPGRPLPVLHLAPIGEPEVSVAEAASLLQAVRELEPGCGTSDEGKLESEVAALSLREAIVLLRCGGSDYNADYVGYRAQRQGEPEPTRLALPGLPKLFTPSYRLTNATYNSASRTLNHERPGSRKPDCGEIGNWVFDGRNFVLAYYGRQGHCGGQGWWDWPRLWISTVEPAEAR